MKIVISIATVLAVLAPTLADAGTSCTSRKSGSDDHQLLRLRPQSPLHHLPKLHVRQRAQDNVQLTPASPPGAV